mgnify:CR=1 FL=1
MSIPLTKTTDDPKHLTADELEKMRDALVKLNQITSQLDELERDLAPMLKLRDPLREQRRVHTIAFYRAIGQPDPNPTR